ncbi:uncharacterized protein METZ01_LOCUS361142, partial [marine metagenome]
EAAKEQKAATDFQNAVKKLSPAERSAYTKNLEAIGFPTLAVRSGKVIGVRAPLTRTTITTQKVVGVTQKKVIKTIEQHIDFLKEDSFFQKAHKRAKQLGIIERNESSREWFQNYALEQGLNYRSMDMLRTGGRRVSDIKLGRMYFFRYRPEQPRDMYDEFPLIFLLSEEPDTFDGINFHYLSPKLRAILLGKMLMYLNNQDYSNRTKLFARKFRSMIQTNKRFKHAKVIYKRYKAEDVQSKILQVHPLDWELAITVPTERFKTVSGGRTMSKKIWLKSAKLAKNI